MLQLYTFVNDVHWSFNTILGIGSIWAASSWRIEMLIERLGGKEGMWKFGVRGGGQQAAIDMVSQIIQLWRSELTQQSANRGVQGEWRVNLSYLLGCWRIFLLSSWNWIVLSWGRAKHNNERIQLICDLCSGECSESEKFCESKTSCCLDQEKQYNN